MRGQRAVLIDMRVNQQRNYDMTLSKNQTKERSIVLTTDEVRTVLEECRFRHRFLVSNEIDIKILNMYGNVGCIEIEKGSENLDDSTCYVFRCPLGNIDDRLWVKEDWKVGAWNEKNGNIAINYRANPELTNTPWLQIDDDPTGEKFTNLWIELSDELNAKGVKVGDDNNYFWEAGQSPLEWREAETMPQWASRITLEITRIRIQPVDTTNKWVWVIDFKVVEGA